MDSIVYGVANCWTQLINFHFHFPRRISSYVCFSQLSSMFSLPHGPHDQVATPSSLWHLLDPDMKASQAARAEPQLARKQGTEFYCYKALRPLYRRDD